MKPSHVFSNTPEGEESAVEFAWDLEEGQWAEVRLPLDPRFGPYTPHFEAEVTIVEPGLPWRSGLEGVARMLVAGTESVIGAFRGEWKLFDS